MQPYCTISSLVCLLSLAALSNAQTTPGTEERIRVPETEVRSGPSPEFYATNRLRLSDPVQIVKVDAPVTGWVPIAPPAGSFSWIDQNFVQIVENGKSALVTSQDAGIRPAPMYEGVLPTIEKTKLPKGTFLLVIGAPKFDGRNHWVPVASPKQEIRYIPLSALRPQPPEQIVSSTSSQSFSQPGRTGEGPWPSQVNATTTSLSRPGSGDGSPIPPRVQTSSQYPSAPEAGHAVRLSPPVNLVPNTGGSQMLWYGPNWCYRTSFNVDGKQAYRCEPCNGETLFYVTAGPGVDLEPFVNRKLHVYGSSIYRGDLRKWYVTVAQVVPSP